MISKEMAWQICTEIRRQNQGKWYTFNGIWCLFCERFGQGDPDKMCLGSSPDYRGCEQVNARFDQPADSRRP